MTPLEQCTHETIVIATTMSPVQKPAWRYGDLAVHKQMNHDAWTITHLPTGLSFARAGVFSNAENAAAAMVEVHCLKNDWSDTSGWNLAELGRLAREVFGRHGSMPSRTSDKFRADKLVERLNGYGNGREDTARHDAGRVPE